MEMPGPRKDRRKLIAAGVLFALAAAALAWQFWPRGPGRAVSDAEAQQQAIMERLGPQTAPAETGTTGGPDPYGRKARPVK